MEGSVSYAALDEKPPKNVKDWTPTWRKLEPLANVNGSVRDAFDAFCARKRITFAALEALNGRYAVRRGRVCLAVAGWNYDGTRVTALKYRPTDGSSHDTEAEKPSVWLRPIVLGKRDALDWVLAEGETDAARLYDLVGDVAAVMVLPAGARAFKREWAGLIPRGATVLLCHDADEEGDLGAEKAALLLGGKTLRVRPPVEGGDWCDWEGSRDELLELVSAAKASLGSIEPLDLETLLAGPVPETDWVWRGWLARAWLALVVADPKVGKSLLVLWLAACMRSGSSCLGSDVKQGRVGILDFENPLPEVHKRLRAVGITADDHEGIAYFHMPSLNLGASEAEAVLTDLIGEHELDLLVIDSARRAAAGLDENDSGSVSAVFTPLRRVSALTGATVVVVHHARKRIGENPTEAGQMVRGSGDLVASVDALLYLRQKEVGSFTLEAVTRHGLPADPVLVRIEGDDETGSIQLVNEGPVAMAEDKVEASLAKVTAGLQGGMLARQVLALRIGVEPKNHSFARALKLGFQRGLLVNNDDTRKRNEPQLWGLSPEFYEP